MTRAELDARFVRPWVQGEMIEHDERRWAPERTRLKILEGPGCALDELGMGRGWGQATKGSEDVTDAVLAAGRSEAPARGPRSRRSRSRSPQRAAEPLALTEVMALAGGRPSRLASLPNSSRRPSRRCGSCCTSGGWRCRGGRGRIRRERWQEVVLRWSTWARRG